MRASWLRACPAVTVGRQGRDVAEQAAYANQLNNGDSRRRFVVAWRDTQGLNL